MALGEQGGPDDGLRHLVGAAATNFDKRSYEPIDGIDKVSCRPDFAVMLYSGYFKVNDQDGNPIEIASVIVWRVIETAEAIFHVDDFEHYVHVQSESAVRTLATS